MQLLSPDSRLNPRNWFAGESRDSLKDGAVANEFAQDLEDAWIGSMIMGAASSAGVHVNAQVALGVSAVFACVAVKANTISTLPFNVYRRLGNDGRELATDHPLYSLLHDAPNEEMTSADWRTALQANLDLHQNAYVIIVRNGFGDIVELNLATPDEIKPERVGRSKLLKYRYRGSLLDLSQVVHLKGLTFNGLTASSLTSTARDAIGLAAALDKNAGYFFKNGSFPGGFIKLPGELKTPEAVKAYLAKWQVQTGGAKAHSTKVLDGGADYKEARAKNSESQFDESRDRQGKECARYFNVPQHKIGITNNQPRANVEQENISFVTDTIAPLCTRWEQSFNQKLLTREERREFFIEFNLNALLRGAFKDRNEGYAKGRQWGWWSVNDIRRMENLNPIGPEGDIYLQPINMADASNPPKSQNEN